MIQLASTSPLRTEFDQLHSLSTTLMSLTLARRPPVALLGDERIDRWVQSRTKMSSSTYRRRSPGRRHTPKRCSKPSTILQAGHAGLYLGRHLPARRRRARARAVSRQAVAAHAHPARTRASAARRRPTRKRSSWTTWTPIRATWRAASTRDRKSSSRSCAARSVLGEIDIDSDKKAAFGAGRSRAARSDGGAACTEVCLHDPRDHAHSRRRHRTRSHDVRSCTILEAAGFDAALGRIHRRRGGASRSHGTTLPEPLLESIRKNKVALKGPITTPIGEGFTSVNVGLRKALSLYANLRPVWNLPSACLRASRTSIS